MRVWSHTLSDRFSRKSSSSLENMAEKDNQSFYNDNNRLRTFRDHINPTRISTSSCIVFPPGSSHFNFKLSIIQLLPTFHELDIKNPYLHLKEFEEDCNTYYRDVHDIVCNDPTFSRPKSLEFYFNRPVS